MKKALVNFMLFGVLLILNVGVNNSWSDVTAAAEAVKFILILGPVVGVVLNGVRLIDGAINEDSPRKAASES